MFIAAALERVVGPISEESIFKVVGEKKARGVGRIGWCLKTQFLARDWRDGGDIQDSNAATATGVSDGTRREPMMDWTTRAPKAARPARHHFFPSSSLPLPCMVLGCESLRPEDFHQPPFFPSRTLDAHFKLALACHHRSSTQVPIPACTWPRNPMRPILEDGPPISIYSPHGSHPRASSDAPRFHVILMILIK